MRSRRTRQPLDQFDGLGVQARDTPHAALARRYPHDPVIGVHVRHTQRERLTRAQPDAIHRGDERTIANAGRRPVRRTPDQRPGLIVGQQLVRRGRGTRGCHAPIGLETRADHHTSNDTGPVVRPGAHGAGPRLAAVRGARIRRLEARAIRDRRPPATARTSMRLVAGTRDPAPHGEALSSTFPMARDASAVIARTQPRRPDRQDGSSVTSTRTGATPETSSRRRTASEGW